MSLPHHVLSLNCQFPSNWGVEKTSIQPQFKNFHKMQDSQQHFFHEERKTAIHCGQENLQRATYRDPGCENLSLIYPIGSLDSQKMMK
jgi:hypothetical protein